MNPPWARHLTEGLALAPATVARRLAAVSAFYRWCVLEQHLTTNPAVHVRRPEVDPDASTTLGLSAEQARALLAAAAEHSPRMLALVALRACQISERGNSGDTGVIGAGYRRGWWRRYNERQAE